MTEQINDKVILEVIDRGLAALGESPKHALWYCLEKDFKLTRQNIPRNLEVFEKSLQGFFGLGYNFLEDLFKNYLSEKTGETFSSQSFTECVNLIRSKKSKP